MKKLEQYGNDAHRNQRKQARRREALNMVANQLGFTTWTRLETAVINQEVILKTSRLGELDITKLTAENAYLKAELKFTNNLAREAMANLVQKNKDEYFEKNEWPDNK